MSNRNRSLALIAYATVASLAATVAFLFSSGCERSTTAPHAKVVSIRFWNGFTGPDGRTMLAIVKRFNAENTDVHVGMQRLEWGTYYNKLFVAGLGNRAPEVFVIHTDSIPRFQQADLLRETDDLTAPDASDPSRINASDFDANVWKAVEHDGRHYSIPLDVHLLGMFYNRALFKQAGIVDERGEAKPPTTRAEFLNACEKITHRGDDVASARWGFVFTWQRTNVYALFRQWGGDIFSRDLSRCTIDSPECVAALQFGVDLIRKLHVAPSPSDINAFIGFRQGKVGMVFEGIYMLPELKRQTDLDWAAAPLPQLGSQRAAWCNSHNLCINPKLTGDELEAAKRFVKYVSDHSLDWAEGGQVPVRRSLRDSARFRSMTAQSEFAKQIPYAAYMPAVTFTNEYIAEYEAAIERALYGTQTPEQALSTAAANIRKVMTRFDQTQANAGRP